MDLVTVDSSWAAVGMPSDWGHLVVDALNGAGPVFEGQALCHVVRIPPPQGAADWSSAATNALRWYGPGSALLVPGLAGHLGTHWLRSPLNVPPTGPGRLRDAIESVLGPLEEAESLSPVMVCRYCKAPTRDGHVEAEFTKLTGLDVIWWACLPCWRRIQAGGIGRHLRLVRRPR
ncbi:MAG: hypothetical protein HOY69_37420 [Streptomyces sp.]|nr:hypothetical protein [Streptomyces sp.]